MNIALIAHDQKKELMAQFCIAYCGILSKHHLISTYQTAKYITDATGLEIENILMSKQGGIQQLAARASYDEIDVLLFFHDTDPVSEPTEDEIGLLCACDQHNIPVATNLATAEIVATALDRGELDWRENIRQN